MIFSKFRSIALAALAAGLSVTAATVTLSGAQQAEQNRRAAPRPAAGRGRMFQDDRYRFSLTVPEPWSEAPLGAFQVPGVIRAAWSAPTVGSITAFVQEPGEPSDARTILRSSAKAAKAMGCKVPVEEVRTVAGKRAMWLVETGKGSGGTIGVDGGVETTAHWVAVPRGPTWSSSC